MSTRLRGASGLGPRRGVWSVGSAGFLALCFMLACALGCAVAQAAPRTAKCGYEGADRVAPRFLGVLFSLRSLRDTFDAARQAKDTQRVFAYIQRAKARTSLVQRVRDGRGGGHQGLLLLRAELDLTDHRVARGDRAGAYACDWAGDLIFGWEQGARQ